MNSLALPRTTLYTHWATETPLILDGVAYRVGHMSYGEYFLEPGLPQGEQTGFNVGTLWPDIERAP